MLFDVMFFMEINKVEVEVEVYIVVDLAQDGKNYGRSQEILAAGSFLVNFASWSFYWSAFYRKYTHPLEHSDAFRYLP